MKLTVTYEVPTDNLIEAKKEIENALTELGLRNFEHYYWDGSEYTAFVFIVDIVGRHPT